MGYYLSGSTCAACSTNGLAASCTSTTAHTLCYAGSYLSAANICTAFASPNANCAVATTSAATAAAQQTTCTVCAIGYALNTAGTCVACVDTYAATCQLLTATTTFSLTCKLGYFLSNGVCKALTAGYASYTAPMVSTSSTAVTAVTAASGATYWAQGFKSKAGQLSCAAGYYVGTNSQCMTCGTGIATCGLSLGVVWPYTCSTGYTRTKGAVSSTGVLTYPTCKASNSFYLAVSYIALAAMLVLALF
jgi:hypothetical protein